MPCSCHFTFIDRRGKTPEEVKVLAIFLSSQRKSSFGFIGKLGHLKATYYI